MALIRCDFFAETLDLSTSMTVVLPERPGQIPGATTSTVRGRGFDAAPGGVGATKLLYLLHGLTDDHTTWVRQTSIERYASERGFAVVMPAVHRSFYANETYGMRFWDFLDEELPQVVSNMFRVPERREDTFVAGLSMGGYGAFKWALRRPERFAAAASLSGALDFAGFEHLEGRPDLRALTERIYGGREIAGSDDDLMHLVATADPAGLPRLMLRCGTEDFLLHHNESFVKACAVAGVALDSGFGPGGHGWDYWDEHIPAVLDWMAAGR